MGLKLTALLGILNGNDGVKARAKREETDAYHDLKRPTLFNGFTKTYTPLDEENGDKFPPESEILQRNVEDVLDGLVGTLAKSIDTQTAVDATNGNTTATLVIARNGDEEIVIEKIPVVTLLWLEKQLDNLKALVTAAPELNPTKEWIYNENDGVYVTAPRTSIKTKKVAVPIVLYPATDRHPAQVHVDNQDTTIGHWTTVDRSGAMPATRKRELLTRISELKDAVKTARETANATAEVVEINYGRELLEHLLRR